VSMIRLLGGWDYTLRCEVYKREEVTDLCDTLREVFLDELERCEVASVVKEFFFRPYPFEDLSE
jgi:hypothetical protein